MSALIEAIDQIVQQVQVLSDRARMIPNAELKNAVADLRLALADLRAQAQSLQAQNQTLQEEAGQARMAADYRLRLELRDAAYWFAGEPPPGRQLGPYCTHCYDAMEKLVILRETTRDLRVFGKYLCPVCNHHFGEVQF